MSIAILGASRGLGRALLNQFEQRGELPLLALSRTSPADLVGTPMDLPGSDSPGGSADAERAFQWHQVDLSTDEGQSAALRRLAEFHPRRIIYCAGGGPYGNFVEKGFKDHLWAWQVSFVAAARTLHWALREGSSVEQFVLVGSSIAEAAADPGAASYAAAKHAVHGLFRSVRAESPGLDLRLFSPGYMNTTLLPPNAKPRADAAIAVHEPQEVATIMIRWLEEKDSSGYYRLT